MKLLHAVGQLAQVAGRRSGLPGCAAGQEEQEAVALALVAGQEVVVADAAPAPRPGAGRSARAAPGRRRRRSCARARPGGARSTSTHPSPPCVSQDHRRSARSTSRKVGMLITARSAPRLSSGASPSAPAAAAQQQARTAMIAASIQAWVKVRVLSSHRQNARPRAPRPAPPGDGSPGSIAGRDGGRRAAPRRSARR